MSGTNLFRLILTLLIALWAFVEVTPSRDTPFDAYVVSQVTDLKGNDGTQVRTQEANLAEFNKLLERAHELVKANQGKPNNPFPSLFPALLHVSETDSIDLGQYFGGLYAGDIKNLKKKNRILLTELLKRSKGEIKYGLDLNGGVAITFEVDDTSLPEDPFLRAQAMDDTRKVIGERVDGLGVAEPIVRVKGANQIEVQLAGVTSKDNPDIAGVIGKPALLEFRRVHPSISPRTSPVAPPGYVRMIQENEDPQTGELIEEPVYISKIPDMRGDIISQARPQVTPTGQFEVTMDFTSEGQRRFAETTGRIASGNNDFSVGRLAIVLDGKLISSPTVRERIDSPSARITGNFDQREAIELSNALNNPLDVQLKISEMYEVSPTLASDARHASVVSAAVGCGLVAVFMIAYYGLAGVVAMILVVLNVGIVLGALCSFGANLSLPGIAGLVLTVGMAVDANILILERMREELRAGKNIQSALQAGYEKAFSTIIDANTTTLITALLLFWLGTGPVKGFGVTLTIGIFSTIFCALVASRWMMELLVDKGVMKDPFRFSILKGGNVSFMKFAKPAFITSWVIVAVGATAFFTNLDKAFSIDFRGGDEVTLAYEQKLESIQIAAFAKAQNFGEVNSIYQTVLGDSREVLVIQTESGKGNAFAEALTKAKPQAGLTYIGTTQIGAAVGADVTRGAIISIVLSCLAMLLYIAFRFEFGFGIGAVVATIHDLLMTVGGYFLLGTFFGIGNGQFSAPMIAAILMAIGYSINDTIVVFDRIREELALRPEMKLRELIDFSINRTLSRTILTSATTFLTSMALFLFGAGVVKDFALVFTLGIVTGTFSSIFIASPVFYWYHKGDRRRAEAGEVTPTYDWSGEKAKPVEKA